MGAIGAAQGDSVLRTLLGSCLGLVLYERRLRIGGLAHIVLPTAPAGPCELPGKFVDTAVPALIRKMEQLADGAPLKLWAKIAGGANMFTTAAIKTIGAEHRSRGVGSARTAHSGDCPPPRRGEREANGIGYGDGDGYH